MKEKVGYKMALCERIVANSQGIKLIDLAKMVGPNGSLYYGYAIVHRTVSAGMIRLVERNDRAGAYRVYL